MRSYKKKTIIIVLAFVLTIVLIKAIPTFCNMIFSRQDDSSVLVWDGTIATSFKNGSGSSNDPYIISTPSEFMLIFDAAYNSSKYFKIESDLFFNNGSFDIYNEKYQFIKKNVRYNLEVNSNVLYDDNKASAGTINLINEAKDFNGYIDGGNHTLYGLFISAEDAALFKSYTGEVNNLKVANCLILGNQGASLFKSTNNTKISKFIFNGYIVSNGEVLSGTKELETPSFSISTKTYDISIPSDTYVDYYRYENISFNGSSTTGVTINGESHGAGNFNVPVENTEVASIIVKVNAVNILGALNLTYDYSRDIASIIGEASNTEILQSVFKGNIKAKNIGAGFIGKSLVNNKISNSYSNGVIGSEHISAGLVGYSEDVLNITNSYNDSTITSSNIGAGMIGRNSATSTTSFTNTFNKGSVTGTMKGHYLGNNKSSNITGTSNYYFDNTSSSVGVGIASNIASYMASDSYLTVSNLNSNNYNSTNGWTVSEGVVPYLDFDDHVGPNIRLKFGDKTWNNINDVSRVFTLDKGDITISSSDDSSEILKEEYYFDTSCNMNIGDYTMLDYSLYDSSLKVDKNGCFKVIAKVTDTAGNVSYANTDMIIYNEIDNSNISYDNKTYDSKVTLYKDVLVTYKFKNNLYGINNGVLFLESLEKLDNGIKISLRNGTDVYTYVVGDDYTVSNNKYYYNLALFKKNNTSYNSSINSDISLDVDVSFDLMNVTSNKTLKIGFVVFNGSELISKTINVSDVIISAKNSNSYTINCSNCTEVNLNDLNSYNYNISINKTSNIYDGSNLDDLLLKSYITYDDKIVTKDNIINNLAFSSNGGVYIRNNGYSNIDVSSNTINLGVDVINTYNVILTGDYYLNLKLVNKYNKLSSNVIKIPIVANVTRYNGEYTFNVLIPELGHYIEKKELKSKYGKTIDVGLKYTGSLINPEIRLGLYKYLNNGYEEVDVCNYINCNGKGTKNNQVIVYSNLVTNKTYKHDLVFNYSSLSYGEYKLVYSLYDSDTFISSREDRVIVW